MSTAQPNFHSPDRLVRVAVTETVEQVNARGPKTAEQFLQFAADNGRCELLRGKVRMISSAGSEHGYIANQIAFLLTSYVRRQKLGRVYAAETGFVLRRSPDTVRAPDVAFIATDRLSISGEGRGFGEVIPDLVVEVRSPSDRLDEVAGKTKSWLDAGVRCVINVDPQTATVVVHRSADDQRSDDQRTYVTGDTIALNDIVANWNPTVESFFESDD